MLRRVVLCLLASFLAGAALVSPALAVDGQMGVQDGGYPLGSGSGGNRFFWAELLNTDHRVRWPSNSELNLWSSTSRSATDYEDLTRDMSQWECRGDNRTSVFCPIWISDPKEGSLPGWHEFHQSAPYPFRLVSPDVTVAYNIRIWRQNRGSGDGDFSARDAQDPIFERRVGLSPGSDADPRGSQQMEWWNGSGDYGLWTTGGSQAGPIGRPRNDAGQAACHRRFRNANNPISQTVKSREAPLTYRSPTIADNGCYWEGADFAGGNAIGWTQHQDGRVSNGCNPQSNRDKCLRESLQINVSLPIREFGWPKIKYKLTGRPSTFYMIQIVALDNREFTRPIIVNLWCSSSIVLPVKGRPHTPPKTVCHTDRDPGAIAVADNYLRVWQPTVPTEDCELTPELCCELTPELCCPEGSDRCNAQRELSKEPGVSLGLQTPNTTVTRSRIDQTVTTAPDGDLDVRQAAFVRLIGLQHFTPQLSYNGARGGASYGREYVAYDSDSGIRLPAATMGPGSDDVSRGPRAGQFMQFAALYQAPKVTLDPSQTNNRFRTAWERPTLTNPCSEGANNPELRGAWPTSSDVCESRDGADLRNAWDDIFNATTSYETRFASRSSLTPDLGVIRRQHLRCDDKDSINPDPAAGREEAGKPISECRDTTLSLFSLPASESQFAQGYLFVEGKRNSQAGAVNVNLQTNRPDLTEPWTVTERADGTYGASIAEGVQNSYAQRNTITGRPEAWFCKQGPPHGKGGIAVHLNDAPNDGVGTDITAESNLAGDDLNAGQGEDADCQGWAVAWNWSYQDPNTFDQTRWTDTTVNPCQPNTPGPYGGAGQFPIRWPASWQIALHGGRGTYADESDIPYAGRRPGRRWGNEQPCHVNLPGHYTRGYWTYTYAWQQNPDTPGQCVYRHAGQAGANPAACSSRSWTDDDGNTQPYYRGGYQYRTSADITWDESSCDYRATSQSDTTIYEPGGGPSTSSQPTGVNRDNPVNKFTMPLRACIDREDGHVQTGSWEIAGDVETEGNRANFIRGRGWGENNSGPRLPKGGYLFTFPFKPLSDPTQALSVEWDMTANYEGHREWQWRTNWRTNDPFESADLVRVYAPRGTR